MRRFEMRPAGRIALIVALSFLLASVGRADLVGYWPMDEATGSTAFDASANSNNGAVSGATWTGGKLAGGLDFDGSGDWVDCGTDSSLNIGTGNFTYSLWFKGHDSGTWRWILNQNGDAYGADSIFITTIGSAGSGTLRVSMGAWFTDVQSGSLTPINDDAWYHLAVTRSGTNAVNIYVNGMKEGNTGTSSAPIGITRPLYIGRGPGSGTIFTGTIDDVGVWNNALDARKVAAVAGLGDFVAVGQNSSQIDDVVALSAPGQSATAGGQTWSYTSVFPTDSGGATLKAGMHYTGTNAKQYIILEDQGTSDFRGVTNAANANLVSHWKFDDGSGQTALDSGAMGNHGMLGTNSGADANDPTWVGGKIGGGLRFDGDYGVTNHADWVDCGNNSSLDVGTGDFTYSLWFKGTATSWRWLLNQNGGSGLVYTTHGTKLRFSMGTWFHDVAAGVTNIAYDDDTWHHVTLTRENGTVTSYLDGMFESSTTNADSASAIGINLGHLFIGRYANTSGFNGVIDDVGVWHEALTARRIAAVVGLGDFAGVDLADSGIDDVLALSTLGQTAAAGGIGWFLTDLFPDHPDSLPLVAGMHYIADGRMYVILEGNGVDGFLGVASVPEPATALLLALGALACLAGCRRRR